MQIKTIVGISLHNYQNSQIKKIVIILNVGEDVENQISSTSPVGIQNVTGTLENSLVVPFKLKNELTILPRIALLCIYAKIMKTYFYAEPYT